MAKEGEVPSLKVYLRRDETEKYCGREADLRSTAPRAQRGDWFFFSIPLEDFACAVDVKPDRIGFESLASDSAGFCLDQIVLYK